MTIFVEDKLKPSRVGQRLADASDIEATGNTTMQAEIDSLKSTTATAEPVGVGQSFRFVDGDTEYEGLVFNVDPNTFEIDFADSTLDIPAVSAGPFHVVGAHLVSQYTEGLVFSRVRSTTSTGGVGDIEAVVIETISFTDGESFVIPNTQSNVRLGLMKADIDPDTEVVYETARSNTGEQLGSAFRHPAYTNTRQVVFTLDDSSQATSAANIYLVPNKYAIGPTAGNSSDAAVITSTIVNSSNPLQVIVSLASEISLLNGGSSSQVSRYDVESEIVRHITVESASGAELSNGTLYLGTPPSSGGLNYPAGNPGGNNELLVGTSNANEIQGTGIVTLLENGIRKLPVSAIQGATEIPSNVVALTSSVNLNQVTQFNAYLGNVAEHTGANDIVFDLPTWDGSNLPSGTDFDVADTFAVRVLGTGQVRIRTINTTNGYIEVVGTTSLVVGQGGFVAISKSSDTNRFTIQEDFVFNPPARDANVPGFVNISSSNIPVTVPAGTNLSGNGYALTYGVTNARNAIAARIVGFEGVEHMPTSVDTIAGSTGIGQAVTVNSGDFVMGGDANTFANAGDRYTVRVELYMTGQAVGTSFPAEYFDFIITAV